MTKLLWSFAPFYTYDSRPNFDIAECNQVHGNRVIDVNIVNVNLNVSADGMYWKKLPSKSLAIKTADCLPILFLGKNTRCTGAILHCGWRSLDLNIINELFQEFNGSYTMAIMGPAIGECCYEVGAEVLEKFSWDKSNFKNSNLNLQQIATNQIKFLDSKIEIIRNDECTLCNPIYHSFRRDQTKERNWNFIQF